MNWLSVAAIALMSLPLIVAHPQAGIAEILLMPRPESCTRLLTVQKRGCEVENLFGCEIDGEEFFRSETSDAFGLRDVSIGNEGRGLVVFGDPYGNYEVRYDSAQSKSSSTADILAQGHGRIDDVGSFSIFGIKKPFSTMGTVVVEDAPVVISGEALTRFRADEVIQLPPPMGELSGFSYSYLHPESGLVFSGEGSDPFSDDKDAQTRGRPQAIDFPEDAGFGTDTPTFDCGEFSLDHTLRGPQHEDKT
jgi:hypothetical protein